MIFSARWMVAENTFRPPWYHINVMSEFMGLIYGAYDAKAAGLRAGRHLAAQQMLPHGPDVDAFEKASNAELKPHKLEGTLAFMFETLLPAARRPPSPPNAPQLQKDYDDYGHELKKHFNPNQR